MISRPGFPVQVGACLRVGLDVLDNDHDLSVRTLRDRVPDGQAGIGAILVAVTTAANAGVSEDKAGLAAGLLSASQQLGTALGLAIFSAIATARTSTLVAAHTPRDAALTAGFHRALLACAVFLLAAALVALRAANTRGEPATQPGRTPAIRGQVPAPELSD